MKVHEFKLKNADEYQITSSVPMPVKKKRKYPFDQMKIGDSFEVDPAESTALRSAVTYFQNSRGRGTKFSIRKLPDGEVRVWRVA